MYCTYNCKNSKSANHLKQHGFYTRPLRPGLHEPQLPVEWSLLERATASLDYDRRN